MPVEKIHYLCPYCGREIKPEEETPYGVFCCGHDFWLSECVTYMEIVNA